MRALTLCATAVAAFLLAQWILRPHAMAERSTWPAADENRTFLVQHAAPVLGRELTADILWAQTIVYHGGSILGESDQRYLEPYLDAVLEVDPHYKRVYRWAAYAVIGTSGKATQKQYQTSLRYIQKARAVYPNDHLYAWMEGTLYFFDLKSDDTATAQEYKEKGADLIEKAMRMPNAPAIYTELAAAFRTKLGQHERALDNLRETILTTEDSKAREVLIDRMRRVYEQTDMADELEAATKELERSWRANMPYAPPTLYFIVGDRPNPVIEFDELATDRDLFGAEPLDELDPAELDDSGDHVQDAPPDPGLIGQPN